MKGHGYLYADGGNAAGTGSGGAGGRIALHSSIRDEFRGTWSAVGGRSSGTRDMGGPGTVFFQDMLVRDLEWQTRLYVDGGNLELPKPVVLVEKNPRFIERNMVHRNLADVGFEELLLQNMVIKKI